MFDIYQKYQMYLNPMKCAFGVGLGKFLGFMVNQISIEENLEKIQALICWFKNGCSKSYRHLKNFQETIQTL